MSELKAIVRGLYEGIAADADLDGTIEQYIAEDIVEHEELPPGLEGPDKELVRQLFGMMHAAFPDLRVEIHDLVEEGDKVAARVGFIGTHRGEFMGVPPSGNQVRIPVFDLFQLRDDKVIAHWGVADMAALMAPTGAAGAP